MSFKEPTPQLRGSDVHLDHNNVQRINTINTSETHRRVTEAHFASVASRYHSVRITDEGPVRHICQCLPGNELVGLDVGAGNGRYTDLLAQHMAGRAVIVAADLSEPMLRMVREHRFSGVTAAVCCEAERLPIGDGKVDFVTTFNAVHHLELEPFVDDVARVLAARGQLFVYTRTRSQNAQSLWGRTFPEFAIRENRLYDEVTLRHAFRFLGDVDCRSFSFQRHATPVMLAERVRARAYSTFAMYDPDELEHALMRFLRDIPRDGVRWQDQNLLVRVDRGRRPGFRFSRRAEQRRSGH
jgi:SAM-dependent methyltransferase